MRDPGTRPTEPEPPRGDDFGKAGAGGEVGLFARMAAFGLVVGGGYWFLTYEPAGSVLLFAFGTASSIAAIAVFVGRRAAWSRTAIAVDDAGVEPVSAPGWAPLGIAVGFAGLGLGAAFGPWLAIAGLLVTLLSARTWLGTAVRETDAARGRLHSVDDEPA